MLTLALAIMATAWLAEAANDKSTMHIHGSVVFARTGERTPILSGNQVLSAVGAQQMHALGQNFRSRYVNDDEGAPTGLGVQQMAGLASNVLNNDQILIQALDEPYLTASAQAFMQGLYPPFAINTARSNPTTGATGALANGSSMNYPLGGYQYAQVNTLGEYDAQSVFIGGNQNCPTSRLDTALYQTSEQYLQTKASHEAFYRAIDIDMFNGHLAKKRLDYMNAFEIYDYLSYAYVHDSSVYKKLNNQSVNADLLDQLRYLADQKAWYEYGNTTASTTDSDDKAMGGKTLAARILGSLQHVVDNKANNSAPLLSLFFGEYQPMVSLVSLMMVEYTNSNFRSIPPFGSALVFEVFSRGGSSEFPSSTSDLWVQFYYQNGTSFTGDLTPHPMFGHGTSNIEMRWPDFQDMMSRIMVSSLEDWCETCDSPALFCWGVDDSSVDVVFNATTSSRHYKITPPIAGVIGAAATLAVACLLLVLVMLVGGVRFHRVQRPSNSDLGGFKGSTKLASDADLSITKNAASPAGVANVGNKDGSPGRKTVHERVGSWELRQKEFGSGGRVKESPRGSLESVETASRGSLTRSVQPHERV